MARLGQQEEIPSGPASQGPARQSIWTAIHPRLLELVRAHRSTLIFVNSRRIAERLAARSTSWPARRSSARTTDRSRGRSGSRSRTAQGGAAARAGRHVVARARHRHGRHRPGGADRGAAVGGQRPAAHRPRGHTIGAASRGRHRPEVPRRPGGLRRGDARDARGAIESSRYPRNPLDVLAQQIVAMVAMDDWTWTSCSRRRPAAPFAELSRTRVRGRARHALRPLPVGRLRRAAPALTWDRLKGTAQRARRGAARGRHQRRHDPRPRALRRVPRRRARPGAASASWTRRWSSRAASARPSCSAPRRGASRRSPTTACSSRPRPASRARCRSGRRTRRDGRSNSGAHRRAVRELRGMPPAAAVDRLVRHHDLDSGAAENLLRYLDDQAPPPASSPTTGRSSSSAAATSWATGGSAC
jgi:ATP-dependent helicase Lhr and Lhr-like helicase